MFPSAGTYLQRLCGLAILTAAVVAALAPRSVSAQKQAAVQALPYNTIRQRLQAAGDTLLVVNYWATWCKPCVAELPNFELLQAKYGNQGVKVLLLSTDFPEDLETRLKPFVAKKQLQCEVILIDESDPNNWINNVSVDWSGALPATQLWQGGQSVAFHNGELSFEELEAQVKPYLQ